MKLFPLSMIPLGAAALILTACSTAQGPVGAGTSAPATQNVAPTVPPTAHEMERAPVSRTHPDKEAFRGVDFVDASVTDISAQIPNAHRITLNVGEVVPVYHAVALPGDGKPQMAFFLPYEARSVVQIVVERHDVIYVDYFIKAIGPGDTVGGVVERSWLDRRGYEPLSDADMARIQNAIKANPFLISVK